MTPTPPDAGRCCIYIPCYNAARFLAPTVARIPWASLPPLHSYSLLIIDNASTDGSPLIMRQIRDQSAAQGRDVHLILHPVNRGYGGSVKSALLFASQHAFDYLVVLHADGQYAPEAMPVLLSRLIQNPACALHFGSRLSGQPLAGGMPLYKYLANRFLTALQNLILGIRLSEYHSGYRLYRLSQLAGIPIRANSDGFVFDNEILFQLAHFRRVISESPIPTRYGEEKSHVPIFGTPLMILRCSAAYLLFRLGLRRDSRYLPA